MSEEKLHICLLCSWAYDEKEGDPANGIPPGTKWEDVPDSWMCPMCGVSKDEFEAV